MKGRNSTPQKRLFIFLSFILLISPAFTHRTMAATTGQLNVYFFNIGKADATLIELNNHYILVDTGQNNSASNQMIQFLKKKGVTTLDYCIISHYDSDHVGGVQNVVNAGIDVKKFVARKYSQTSLEILKDAQAWGPGCIQFDNYVKFVNAFASSNKLTSKLTKDSTPTQVRNQINTWRDNGYSWAFYQQNQTRSWQGATLKFMQKNTTYLSKGLSEGRYKVHCNNDSMCFQLKYNGKIFFFSGDVSNLGNTFLIENYPGTGLKCDVYKAAHHGINFSNFIADQKTNGRTDEEKCKKVGTLARALSPKYTVITDGNGTDIEEDWGKMIQPIKTTYLRTSKLAATNSFAYLFTTGGSDGTSLLMKKIPF